MHRRNRVFRRIGEGGRERELVRKEGREVGGGKWKGMRGGGKVCDPSDGSLLLSTQTKNRFDSASAAKILAFLAARQTD